MCKIASLQPETVSNDDEYWQRCPVRAILQVLLSKNRAARTRAIITRWRFVSFPLSLNCRRQMGWVTLV